MIERVDPSRRGVWVLMDDQFHPRFFGGLFPQRIHVLELPCRVDMHEREGRGRWIECFLRKVQHDGAVLADRIKHHGLFRLCDDFAHDMDALGFEPLEMGQGFGVGHGSAPRFSGER